MAGSASLAFRVVGVMAAGAVAAGCSSAGGSSSAAPTSSVSTAASAAAVSSSAASSAGSPAAVSAPTPTPVSPRAVASSPASPAANGCATRDLQAKAGIAQGAAGSVYQVIDFTNISNVTCTLYGYPGVSLAAGTPVTQVGAAASRSTVAAPATVTLAPGQTANALLRITQALNYPSATCSPAATTYLQIFPPGPPTGRPQTPGWSRCPSARSSTCSPPPSASPGRPPTPPGGSSGDAATRHYPAGSTNAHAWHATTPWSASNCRLPY